MPEVKRNKDGVIINAAELTHEDVVGEQVECPACHDKVFKQWPLGWDGHAGHACSALNGDTQEVRKEEFKAKYRHLFRPEAYAVPLDIITAATGEYIDELCSLRMNPNPVSGQKSPHKPAMLLAIIDLISSGAVSVNHFEYGPELLEHFRLYFDAVKTDADSFTPLNPFWHLKTSSFWHHTIVSGKEDAYRHMGRPRGPNVMGEVVTGVELDDELFSLFLNPDTRAEIREALIARYFPQQHEALVAIAQQEEAVGVYAEAMQGLVEGRVSETPDISGPARDLAFARIVKRAYHHQCAACGLRVFFQGFSLVDAAHIIPFSISHDDDPRNGMSLCKNHHWAMDQELIFPCADNKWRVHNDLDDRVDAQRSLIALDGKSILLPDQPKYAPRQDVLAWRENRMQAV
ncbi:HNH endonuclease [Pontiellaceae bacterium B12227]|nr:HNH endonuclease [Pontiellaceae bacterium B12227]